MQKPDPSASNGIGAGLIVGGRPYRGSFGLAGGIGHIRLERHTEPCRFCDLLNPDALVLGGELGIAHPQFVDGVRSSVQHYCQPATSAVMHVVPAMLGTRAELAGAMELASAWAA